jgi:hypothetical protein
MKTILLVVFILLIMLPAPAQDSRLPEIISDIAEELAASTEEQETSSVYLDRLYDLSENPVDLNSGNEGELSRLFFLSRFQIRALADYTHSTGRIVSMNEIAYIPGFDRQTAEMIIPFATIRENEILRADSVRMKNLFINNLSLKRNSTDTAYMGSAFRLLSRYRFTRGNLSGGLTMEKDQGEKILIPGTINPDFFSANLTYTGKGLIKKIITGDYSARFGMGTGLNTSFPMGMSMTSGNIINTVNEVKPYNSSDENNYFRGLASVLSYRNTDLFLFFSRNRIDATLTESITSQETCIKSFYRTGIHNTPGLLLKRDAVLESVSGAGISSGIGNLSAGILIMTNSFSFPVMKDTSDIQKLFSFSGRNYSLGSLWYNTMIRKIMLRGEISANNAGKYAVVQGISARPGNRLILNLLVWKYSEGYTALHGREPGGNMTAYPGHSIMGNFTFEAARHLFAGGGVLIQFFPWLKYRCSSPSESVRKEFRLKYQPDNSFSVDLLYAFRQTMADKQSSQGIPDLTRMITRSFKATVRYSVNDFLTFTTRMDYRICSPSGSVGTLLLEDISWKSGTVPLSVWTRYCIFGTDDYDSRIYTYENDMLYSFSIPALYGKGSRLYFMAGWKFKGKAELRFKYGFLSKSQNTLTDADTGEFRIQLKITI